MINNIQLTEYYAALNQSASMYEAIRKAVEGFKEDDSTGHYNRLKELEEFFNPKLNPIDKTKLFTAQYDKSP